MFAIRLNIGYWVIGAAVVLATFLCTPAQAETITITGTVLTPDGQPAAGARVFTDWTFPKPEFQRIAAETTTAADGSFSLQIHGEGEPGSSGTVAAMKDGLGLGWSRVELDRDQRLEIQLNEEAPLAGAIRDQAGTAIPGATVSLGYVRGDDVFGGVMCGDQLQTTSDTDGAFALGGLPAGRRCSFMISATGYATMRWSSEAVDDAGKLMVVLPLEAVITGTVTRGGAPVPDVHVGCQETDESSMDPPPVVGSRQRRGSGSGWGSALTDDDGRYRIAALYPGAYNLCLDAPDGWTAVAHEGVTCKAGQLLDNIDFQLIEGGLVTGTVTDADTGEPVARTPIGFYGPARPWSGAWCQATRTDENGQYQFRLPPGKNRVYVQASGADPNPSRQFIDVVAGQTITGIDFLVSARRKVTGTVLYPDLQPAPDAHVRVSSYSVSPSHTDKDGHFELSIPPSQFPVEFTVRVVDRKLIGRGVASDPDEDVRLVLQPEAVVTGAIASADGEGIANVQIKCRHVPPHREGAAFSLLELGTATTDDNGRFELALLPADVELKLQILGDAGMYVPQTQWPDELMLEPGETRDIGTATVDMKGRTIRGLVLDAERVLQPDCLVLDISSSAKARTDELGRFELTGLPYKQAGSLSSRFYEANLLAMDPELPLFAGDFGIDPDWGFEPNMVLEPLGKVQGRLLDAEGKPVAKQEIGLEAQGMWRRKAESYPEAYQRGARLWDTTETDADGKWTFDGMIGGLRYTVHAYRPGGGSPIFWQDIRPEPGQTVDLGDITARQPDQG